MKGGWKKLPYMLRCFIWHC